MIAANPGPAVHLAALGAVIVIGLLVYAIVRVRRRREAAEAELLNEQEQIEHGAPASARDEQ